MVRVDIYSFQALLEHNGSPSAQKLLWAFLCYEYIPNLHMVCHIFEISGYVMSKYGPYNA